MPQTSLKQSRTKAKIKERIMEIPGWYSNGLTELYLEELSLKKLRDIYSIAKTMRLNKAL